MKLNEWQIWLTRARFWHNTTWKSSTGFTPYKVVYGRAPPSLLHYVPNTARVEAVEDSLYDRDRMGKILKDQLTRARDCMKVFADRHRIERHFEVGDHVLLKLQPYRQTFLRSSMP